MEIKSKLIIVDCSLWHNTHQSYMLLYITSILVCPVIANYLSKYMKMKRELLDAMSVVLAKMLCGSKCLCKNSKFSVLISHSHV